MDHTEQHLHDNEPMDLDDVLPQVGEFGRYQKIMLWFVCLPACFPCGFCAFNQLFMAGVPDHWCWVPDMANLTIDERRQLAIPQINGTFSKCQRYARINYNETNRLEDCLDGWEFDRSEIQSSIVIDFSLVCEKDIYPTIALAFLNFGGPIGVYFFGFLNDKIGRKKSFFACLTTLIVGGSTTAFATNFWMWASSRLIVGLTVPAIYQIPFIISLELVGPNYRSFVTILTCTFYTFGLMMLAGVAYVVRDWSRMAAVTSLPFMFYYIYWFFLPESPRWLLAKGRFEEASKILERLAEVNGNELPAGFKQQLKQRILRGNNSFEDKETKRANCLALCKTPNMRLKTTLITFNWFANQMVYVGLSYYGPSLGKNEYFSFFLSSAVEIPSYMICWLIMDRWGRRWPLCLCMVISGFSCIATVLLPEDAVTTTLVLFLLAKSTISASFLIIYPFAGELYPTQLRGLGIGTSAYIAGLGLVFIPFITYLGSEMLVLPLFIMGIVSVIGGLSGLRLPETLHHRLPQTVEDGEKFGKDFTMQDCLRCIPLKPVNGSSASYEDLELNRIDPDEDFFDTDGCVKRKLSLQRLARQQSIMDTQKDVDGSIKLTYWF